jgi:hypothetical protein
VFLALVGLREERQVVGIAAQRLVIRPVVSHDAELREIVVVAAGGGIEARDAVRPDIGRAVRRVAQFRALLREIGSPS